MYQMMTTLNILIIIQYMHASKHHTILYNHVSIKNNKQTENQVESYCV